MNNSFPLKLTVQSLNSLIARQQAIFANDARVGEPTELRATKAG